MNSIGPASISLPNYESVCAAASLIHGGVIHTPCTRSTSLFNALGVDVWLKKEFLQSTGSFKERGARHALLRLTKEQAAKE